MEADLAVREALTPEYVGVSESDTVLGAVRLMREERVGAVLVVRGSEPVGIVTEWDVLGVVDDESDAGSITVESVMSAPVITMDPDRALSDAAEVMARENIRNLVVEADGEVVGVLTQRDIIAAAGSFPGTTGGGPPMAERPSPPAVSVDRQFSAADEELQSNGGEEYSSQGVCERCGSLVESLYDVDGQLLCTDCGAI